MKIRAFPANRSYRLLFVRAKKRKKMAQLFLVEAENRKAARLHLLALFQFHFHNHILLRDTYNTRFLAVWQLGSNYMSKFYF